MITISAATSAKELAMVRRLFGEYQRGVEDLLVEDDTCP